MIHALHGNAGLPDDLLPLLRAVGQPFHAWHLWRTLSDHPETASLAGFAAHLNAFAAREAHRPRILLGYSLGARLALHALTQQPQLWDAAILLSVHPGLTTAEARAARLPQDQSWAGRFLREPWSDVMTAWNAQAVFRSATFQFRVERADRPLDFGKSSDIKSWREQIALGFDVWSLGRQDDLRPLLPSVHCPVLFLTGVRDEKFTALAAGGCALMPHAHHIIIPGAGHRTHLDQPGIVSVEVARFLRDSCPA